MRSLEFKMAQKTEFTTFFLIFFTYNNSQIEALQLFLIAQL